MLSSLVDLEWREGLPWLCRLSPTYSRGRAKQHLVVGQGKHVIETEHEATQRVEKISGEASAQHGSKG
ncbi:hypothetical protein H5410_064695 [Solanum commersonii]|uniref:Uncharacterized protein n=1 Tax=Solanum commersonii TaxID=4109 RepID=A0A9J5VYZ1_SOLCO|nr:hypothetical protein H5410_064695 [Solanum commersonii]